MVKSLRRSGRKFSPSTPAWKFKVNALNIFFNHQEPYLGNRTSEGLCSYYYFFLLWCGFTFWWFARASLVHSVRDTICVYTCVCPIGKYNQQILFQTYFDFAYNSPNTVRGVMIYDQSKARKNLKKNLLIILVYYSHT